MSLNQNISSQDLVDYILKNYTSLTNQNKTPLKSAKAFAPSNIALVKYWGKRNLDLNLPLTSSLSISLDNLGTETEISIQNKKQDKIILNNKICKSNSAFSIRLSNFLNYFRTDKNYYFNINTHSNIPIGAGLASSASGFAAIILALNQLFQWELSNHYLSILARLGSGSAARSIEPGFNSWTKGLDSKNSTLENGLSSFAENLNIHWPEFRIGLLIISNQTKPIGSTEAMIRTQETSYLYSNWPKQVENDLDKIILAIENKDFNLLGQTAEHNALSMHATMLSSWPPIQYSTPKTLELINHIWLLRNNTQNPYSIYFTQDAGPNLKCLFLEKDQEKIIQYFKKLNINIKIIEPFK